MGIFASKERCSDCGKSVDKDLNSWDNTKLFLCEKCVKSIKKTFTKAFNETVYEYKIENPYSYGRPPT
jgi:predicted amidophosphoribosyltransferase